MFEVLLILSVLLNVGGALVLSRVYADRVRFENESDSNRGFYVIIRGYYEKAKNDLDRAHKEIERLASRIAMLKIEHQLQDGGDLPTVSEPLPELTGDLRRFIDGIQTEEMRDAIRIEARQLLSEGTLPTAVLDSLRGAGEAHASGV